MGIERQTTREWNTVSIGDDREGPPIMVTISPDDGPDDIVVVNAGSKEAAIRIVKQWLESIDYDPSFHGVRFTAEWPDADSITLLEATR